MTVLISHGEDIFLAGSEAIVNPVNCVGVMGKGLALEFKNRFPSNMKAYSAACRSGALKPGGLFVFDQADGGEGGALPRWIVNLATKDHWRDPSQLSWITEGSKALRAWAEATGVKSIDCPALGAGWGGLDWAAVQSEIEEAFKGASIDLRVHAPREQAMARKSSWKP